MDVETNSLPLKPPIEDEQDVQDATDLAAMGHAQALTRKFNIWSMLALAFCVLGMRHHHPLAVATWREPPHQHSLQWANCVILCLGV